MQIWSAILSNTKTAEEIRDGSPSFTIRLVLVKNVTLNKFRVVNLCQMIITIRLVLVKNVTLK